MDRFLVLWKLPFNVSLWERNTVNISLCGLWNFLVEAITQDLVVSNFPYKSR